MRKLTLAGAIVVAVVSLNCGANMVGSMLTDAGAWLSDAGNAQAQATCTWTVKRISALNSNNQALSEVPIPSGWEPFAYDPTFSNVLVRRCQ